MVIKKLCIVVNYEEHKLVMGRQLINTLDLNFIKHKDYKKLIRLVVNNYLL